MVWCDTLDIASTLMAGPCHLHTVNKDQLNFQKNETWKPQESNKAAQNTGKLT